MDVENLQHECALVSDDLIEIFDACLALKPQRKDVIAFYMDLSHVHLLKLLGAFWEKNGIDLNPFESLSIIDYSFTYYNKLRKFGVREDFLYNGFLILCNAYARKIHS